MADASKNTNMSGGNRPMVNQNLALKPKRRVIPTKFYLGYLEHVGEEKTAKNGEKYSTAVFQVFIFRFYLPSFCLSVCYENAMDVLTIV